MLNMFAAVSDKIYQILQTTLCIIWSEFSEIVHNWEYCFWSGFGDHYWGDCSDSTAISVWDTMEKQLGDGHCTCDVFALFYCIRFDFNI